MKQKDKKRQAGDGVGYAANGPKEKSPPVEGEKAIRPGYTQETDPVSRGRLHASLGLVAGD